MSQANVDDLDIFRYVKTGLIKFRQVAETSLINADAQLARTLHWLENEQMSHWQNQIRKRQEMVMRWREAVRAKQLFKDSSGRTPSAAQEEKQLRTAVAALEEAEMKLASTKRHIPQLQKEIESYRGSIQGLGAAIASDLPKAMALLDRLSATLQEYTDLQSAAAASPGEPSATPAPEGNMNRGGEDAQNARPEASNPDKGDANVTG